MFSKKYFIRALLSTKLTKKLKFRFLVFLIKIRIWKLFFFSTFFYFFFDLRFMIKLFNLVLLILAYFLMLRKLVFVKKLFLAIFYWTYIFFFQQYFREFSFSIRILFKNIKKIKNYNIILILFIFLKIINLLIF